MAKTKTEDVEEVEEEKESKSTKATAVALFKTFPKEVQYAIDEFVKQFKTTGDVAQKVLQLCEQHNLRKEEVAHVIKEKMKMLGLKPPNVNTMLGITKALPDTELDEAAQEEAESEEEGLPFISVSLKGMNKSEVVAGINTSTTMNVYYSEEDKAFVRIEFI
jgi:hypothetical protein